ncbi:hypothetical protein AB0C40_29250 [Streptomyces brevispora]|uniref:hypothetical protein n=1 Tax=Streptomyces brevispora TaxID=887462 RepID=UPI0033E08B24
MSWDVLLLRLPDCIASVQDIPDGYLPPPLGRRRDVLAAVTRAVPGAGLADPDRGELRGPTWSMGLDIGSTDPVDSIMLHVRGSGDDALTTVFRLAEALHCKVLDCSEGELITPGGTPGWHAFQQYRDRVTSSVH